MGSANSQVSAVIGIDALTPEWVHRCDVPRHRRHVSGAAASGRGTQPGLARRIPRYLGPGVRV
jgi:hypothetical protein